MPAITYFLIIGIENYIDPIGFPKVAYARNDSEEIMKAFIELGYDKSDFVFLQDNKATKTAIESNLELITKKAMPDDRIIFYFAGHGISSGDKNMLVSADTISGFLEKTCVSIGHILVLLKKSKTKRNILFLDCCHSGFEPGALERKGSNAFDSDRLKMEYRDEEYCIGFASCQSHQISISDNHLKQGVWSHFLVQALRGKADNVVYKEGCLFSDSLQEYLRDRTAAFVKLNTTPKKDQTPVQFGHLTKRFIIEDLSPLFDAMAAAKISSTIKVKSIAFIHHFDDLIKRHPGFIKGKHFVPKEINSHHDTYIKRISESIVEADIDEFATSIRKEFKYTLKQIKIEKSPGSGEIVTPDFDYKIEIAQSKQSPDEYTIIRSVENFDELSIIESESFNNVFESTFNDLIFYFDKKIDVEDVIEKIESLPAGSLFSVEYSHNDLSRCTIKIEGLSNTIIVEPHALAITSTYKSTPQELINSFKEASKLLVARKIGLLSD